MWEGQSLPETLECDCKPGDPHHKRGYKEHPICRGARESPAGSSHFLETDFQQALIGASTDDQSVSEAGIVPLFTIFLLTCGDKRLWIPRLACQAILPSLRPNSPRSRASLPLQARLDELDLHPSLLVGLDSNSTTTNECRPFESSSKGAAPPMSTLHRLKLFSIDMPGNRELEATIIFTSCNPSQNLRMGLYLRSFSAVTSINEYRDSEIVSEQTFSEQTMSMSLDTGSSEDRVVEIGFYCTIPVDANICGNLIRLHSLVIKPRIPVTHDWKIFDVEASERHAGVYIDRRLSWKWGGTSDCWPSGLPWSKTSGPFSSFAILCDGREVGRAHCLQFRLFPDDWAGSVDGGETIMIQVRGYLVGGGTVHSPQVSLPRPPMGSGC